MGRGRRGLARRVRRAGRTRNNPPCTKNANATAARAQEVPPKCTIRPEPMTLADSLAIGGGRLSSSTPSPFSNPRSPASFDRSRPEHREAVAQVQALYTQLSEEA